MLYDGINLTSGAGVTNLVVETVTTLPAVVVGDKARLLYLSTAYSSYSVGLYYNDGTSWVMVQPYSSVPVAPYDVGSCVIDKPDAGATVAVIAIVRAFTIPSNFTGSSAKAGVAATAPATFTVNKNGSSIGTFAFAASGTTGTFSGAGATFAAGDVISVVAPGSQDATLANIAFTIAGNLQ